MKKKKLSKSTKDIDETYFTQSGTESDHFAIECMLREGCEKSGVELIYYRKFKTGHIPMYRECKIKGDKGTVIKMLRGLDLLPLSNYWREHK